MYNNKSYDRSDQSRHRDRDRDWEENDRDYRSSSGGGHRSSRDDRDGRSRDHHRSGEEDESRNPRKSRSRWDDREPAGASKPSSRWDRAPEIGNDGSLDDQQPQLREERRDRSRSRSSSPFRRSDRDYSSYSNPTRRSDASDTQESRRLDDSRNERNFNKKTGSNWSDSSDEDDYRKHGSGSSAKTDDPVGSSNDEHSYRNPNPTPSDSNIEYDRAPNPVVGVSLKLNSQSKPVGMPLPKILSVPRPVTSTKVASIFNDDDDSDEPEEMPTECKMRMKNVGRETKTSEGPNSFGKTKIGFCNLSHLAEKELEGKGSAEPSRSKKKY